MSTSKALPTTGGLTPSSALRDVGGLLLDTVEALGAGVFVRPCEKDCDVAHEHDYERRDVHAQLVAWWSRVHAEGERLDDINAGALASCVTIRASGKGGAFPLCIGTPHWRVFVNPWSARARFVVSAYYLATTDLPSIRCELQRVAAWLWGDSATLKLSQLHLATDFVGANVQRYARLDDVLTHAKRVDAFYDDASEEWQTPTVASVHASHRRITGVTIGSAASRLQVCIYDKTEQLRATRHPWGLDYLRDRGWNGSDDVTRIECRFRARALDEFPKHDLRSVEALDAFAEWGPQLWRYATTKGVRYVVPRETRTRSRWPMREDWRAIVASSRAPIAKRSRRVVVAQKDEAVKRACASFLTSAIRLAAEDPSAMQSALATMDVARSHGESSSRGLIMAVLVKYADGICTRALGGETNEHEKHLEIRERLAARRRHVESRDAPPTYDRPTLAKAKPKDERATQRVA